MVVRLEHANVNKAGWQTLVRGTKCYRPSLWELAGQVHASTHYPLFQALITFKVNLPKWRPLL